MPTKSELPYLYRSTLDRKIAAGQMFRQYSQLTESSFERSMSVRRRCDYCKLCLCGLRQFIASMSGTYILRIQAVHIKSIKEEVRQMPASDPEIQGVEAQAAAQRTLLRTTLLELYQLEDYKRKYEKESIFYRLRRQSEDVYQQRQQLPPQHQHGDYCEQEDAKAVCNQQPWYVP